MGLPGVGFNPPVSAPDISDDSITTNMLADEAVNSDKVDGTIATLVAGKIPESQLGSGTGTSTKFLSGANTWITPGSNSLGNVIGPASAISNNVPKYLGTTGKILQDGFTVGVSASNLVQLDGSAKLPAVDGSALINLTAANLLGTLPAIDGSALTGMGLYCITKTGVDGVTPGATLIGTTLNNGKRFYPIYALINVATADTPIAVGSLSIGTNSTSYNNILAITALTGLATVNTMLKLDFIGAMSSTAPNTGIYLKVTTGFTATSLTFDLVIFGFYR